MSFTYSLDIDQQQGLLRISCQGELTCADEGEKVLRQAVEFSELHNLQLLLVDIRQLSLTFEAFSMLDIMLNMRDQGWLKGKRIARVLAKENFSHLLIGDISESMDLPIRNFDSEQRALEWLKEIQ
jgi:hypothetical protein